MTSERPPRSDRRRDPASARGTRCWARVTRGLEWVAAAEVRSTGARIHGVAHRSVFFGSKSLDAALSLRSIDDLFVHACRGHGVDRTRESLARLAAALERVDLERALRAVQSVRSFPRPCPFRVSSSFLGRRNYNREQLDEIVAAEVARRTGMIFEPADQPVSPKCQIAWRLHLQDDRFDLGVRVTKAPLHRRGYKTADVSGTLHPPVAAAMGLVAGLHPGHTIIDPFCGAGTILIEAKLLVPEIRACGRDINPRAVEAARQNAERAGRTVAFTVGDASGEALLLAPADRLISNVPWNHAALRQGSVQPGLQSFCRQLGPALKPGARAVLLVEDPLEPRRALRDLPLRATHQNPLRVAGRIAHLLVLEPAASARGGFDPEHPLGELLSESWRAVADEQFVRTAGTRG